MKLIKLVSVASRIPDFFAHPLRLNRRRLREMGYDLSIAYGHEAVGEADVLMLSSAYFSGWWDRPESVFAYVEKARKTASKIVWCDDADSTSTTHFELLPVVDLYLKKQILKDRSLYATELYGDRVFTDFYHRRFGIKDDTPYNSKPLDMSLAHKLQLSWHIGLGDMYHDILPRPVKSLLRLLPARYSVHYDSPRSSRDLDVMFRGSRKYARPTVSFHRERIGEILDAMQGVQGALAGRVSIKEYRRETARSKMIVSPFGWGEIGVRDFEAWIFGSALLKPDMTHMETWPDCFVPGENYYALAWDFSNLESGVRELLEDDGQRLRLAETGQETYRKMVSEEGMLEFCRWFTSQIEK